VQKIVMLAAGVLALSSVAAVPQANAAGCLRGAVVGGAVGHYAGHHGLLGAGIGCLWEHHREAKRERMMERERYDRRW
jgi:hypothetical protein